MEDKYCLVGIDGNAYAIMGYVFRAMRHEGYSKAEIDRYYKKATAGDYDDLLVESMDMIDAVNSRVKERAQKK